MTLQSLGYTPVHDERMPDMATHFEKSDPDIQMLNWPTSSQLCDTCSNIPIGWLLESSRHDYPIFIGFSQLRESAKSCKLCEMILPSIEQFDTHGVVGITIVMTPQFLMIEVLNRNGEPEYGYLRLCADPGK